MADTIVVVKEGTFQSQLSSQRSQNSLYSSPEAVELYQTGSSLGGKPHSGLSSSFILVSDESNCGESPFSPSEYVEMSEEDENKSSSPRSKSRLDADLEGPTAISGEPKEIRLTAVVESTLDVEKKRSHGGAALNVDLFGDKRSPSQWTDSLVKPNLGVATSEVGTQTDSNTRDGCTQTFPEIKEEKRRPSATSPTSVLEHNDLHVSPLGSPNDEVVDMSASTVLIERHISQKEGRILKNNNKELRLKIKKLTDVLESLQKENLRLKNETESKVNEADLQSALELKEKEHRRHVKEMEEQQDLELEQYRNRVQKAVEYETTAEERMKENAKVIAELQKSISVLQEQLRESQKRQETSVERIEQLTGKLQVSETKRTVAESENSVLNEKINHLMKELAVLKKSTSGKHHHHHHHQEQPLDDKSKHQVLSTSSKQSPLKKAVDHASKEDIIAPNSSEEQKQAKKDHLDIHVGATQGSDATKLEASVACQVRSNPKPKPRQKLYESNNQHHHHASNADNKVKQKEPRPKPVQALVAPQLPLPLQSGAAKHIRGELLLPYHQQQQQITMKPPQQKSVPSAAQSKDRPSFLPLKGQAQAAPAHLPLPLEPQAEPTPPLSDAQKLAATASWVQQLPEPKDSKAKETPKDPKTQASAVTWKKECATQGVEERDVRPTDDLNSLSEERIDEITRQLKGENAVVCECPICGKVLHSRESDYGVLLHVELCLQQSAARD